MRLAELETKWTARLQEWRELGVSVNGEKVAAEIVADLRAIALGSDDETLSPRDAAQITGYNAEYIAKLASKGKVANYGTKHRPRVKLSELPRKATVAKSPAAA